LGRELDTRVLLISEGGCFLEVDPAPPKEALLKLSFVIPGKGPHSVDAEVRYTADAGDYRGKRDAVGVGCRFISASATTKQAIRDLIQQVKKNYSQIQFALAISKPTPQLPEMLEKAQLPPMKDARELKEAVNWGLKQMGN
jgi:hypothetical protein